MKPRDAEKLLGGHATGTLTEAERVILFAAALEHQDIFDALMDEEALRDLLAVPEAKAQLLAALAPQAVPKVVPFWRRPGILGAAASLMLASLAGLAYLRSPEKAPVPLQRDVPKAPEAKAPESKANQDKLVLPEPSLPARKQPPVVPPQRPLSPAPAAEPRALPVPMAVPTFAATPAGALAGAPASPAAAKSEAVAEERNRAQAQAEYRRLEAQDSVARQAEASRSATKSDKLDGLGAIANPPLPSPPKVMAKARGNVAPRQDATANQIAPRWVLEAQPDGSTRVTVLAPQGPEAVLVRRGAKGAEVLRLRAMATGETGLVLWQTGVHLAAGDVLDLYLLSRAVTDPAKLPETGPVDGYRVRIHPASKN